MAATFQQSRCDTGRRMRKLWGQLSPAYHKALANGYRAFHFPMHILEQALADSIGREKAIRRLGACSLAFPGRKEKGHEVSH